MIYNARAPPPPEYTAHHVYVVIQMKVVRMMAKKMNLPTKGFLKDKFGVNFIFNLDFGGLPQLSCKSY